MGADVPPDVLKAGDVVVLPFGNTWAEEQVLPADKCVPVNPDADPRQVAFLGINGITPELLLETTDLSARRDSAEDFSRLDALLWLGCSFPRIALPFHNRNIGCRSS